MRVILRDYRVDDDDTARAIYEASFPASLRAPWSALTDHRPDERLLVLADSDSDNDNHNDNDNDNSVAGIALIRRLGDTGMAFVRYLAVDPARRSEGLGSILLDELRDVLRGDGIGVLLLDVEEPLGDHAQDDRRRIAFYERCGLSLLDAPGYAPPDHGATGEIVPLLLMGEVIDGGNPLVGERLAAAVRAVLVHRYGVAD